MSGSRRVVRNICFESLDEFESELFDEKHCMVFIVE